MTDLIGIPSDIISTLGEYMTPEELYQRRRLDSYWDKLYLNRLPEWEHDDAMRVAIQNDDPELVRNLHDLSEEPILQLRPNLRLDMYWFMNLSFKEKAPRVGKALLELWSISSNSQGTMEAVDLMMILRDNDIPEYALGRVIHIMRRGSIGGYVLRCGSDHITRILRLAINRSLLTLEDLIDIVRHEIRDVTTQGYDHRISVIVDIISEYLEGKGMEIITYGVIDILDEYMRDVRGKCNGYMSEIMRELDNIEEIPR